MSDFSIDPVELTRKLVRINTINPPGNEIVIARYLAGLLEPAGFKISYHEHEPGRANMIARLEGDQGEPLCFTGHLDTVPLGDAKWSFDPLAGEISGDKLLGRGVTDMKSGVAAFTAAAIELAKSSKRGGGLELVYTASEETGCLGSQYLAGLPNALNRAGAIIVAEPTANQPGLGHKGVFWYEVEYKGKAAHGSLPEKGDNAIYKAARAISLLADYKFKTPRHELLGIATKNVGTIEGGTKINIVPDKVKFSLDVRVLPGQSPEEVSDEIKKILGSESVLKNIQLNEAIWTNMTDPWVQGVLAVMADLSGKPVEPCGLTYFTDAINLKSAMGNPPVLILGPGIPEQAHQTDEWCSIDMIRKATELYFEIGRKYMGF